MTPRLPLQESEWARFGLFTDRELTALWEGLTTDDGISYGIEESDPDYPLAREMHEEAKRRGLLGSRWEHVV